MGKRRLEHTMRKVGYVWGIGDELFGVLKIHSGRAGHWLHLLLHPDFYDEAPAILSAAIGIACGESGKPGSLHKPVYCGVRSYEQGLASILPELGFEHFTSRVLMVKHVTAKIPLRLPRKATQPNERAEGVTPSVTMDEAQSR
jgi:hypothetical protein